MMNVKLSLPRVLACAFLEKGFLTIRTYFVLLPLGGLAAHGGLASQLKSKLEERRKSSMEANSSPEDSPVKKGEPSGKFSK